MMPMAAMSDFDGADNSGISDRRTGLARKSVVTRPSLSPASGPFSVNRIGACAGNEKRQAPAGDRNVFQEMIKLIAIGDIGVCEESRQNAKCCDGQNHDA